MRRHLLAGPPAGHRLGPPRGTSPPRRGASRVPGRVSLARRALPPRGCAVVARSSGGPRGRPVPGEPARRLGRLSPRSARHLRLRLPRRPHPRARDRASPSGPRRRRVPPRLSPRDRPGESGRPPLGRHGPLGLAHPPRRHPLGPRPPARPPGHDRAPGRAASGRRARALDPPADRLLLRLRRQPAGPLVDGPPARQRPAVPRLRQPDRAGSRPRAGRPRLALARRGGGLPRAPRSRRPPGRGGAVLQGVPGRAPPARARHRLARGATRPPPGALPRRGPVRSRDGVSSPSARAARP